MSTVTVTDYTFDKAAQTVRFNAHPSIKLENVLVITHLTSQIDIFDIGDANKLGTVSANKLTLAYNTTAMADSALFIRYFDPDPDVTKLADALSNIVNAATEDTLQAIYARLTALKSLDNTDSAGYQKVAVATTVALPANQSVDVARVAGTAAGVNIGLSSAGTQRITLADDSQQQGQIAINKLAIYSLSSLIQFN